MRFRIGLTALLKTWLSIVLTGVGLFLAAPTAHAEDCRFHVVLDLDWTLIYTTTEAMARADRGNIIRVDGQPYRFSDYTFEVLASLHRLDGVCVSLFSGGEAGRNKKVAEALYSELAHRVGHSRFQLHRLLSAGDMRQVDDRPGLRFRNKFKKDLGRYFDLARTILIDDVAEFALPDQRRNMLFVGGTYEDRPQWELGHLENSANAAFSAPSKSEWHRERQKLVWALGVVSEAIRQVNQNPESLEFPDAVQNILRKVFDGETDATSAGFRLIKKHLCESPLKSN